MTRPVRYYCGVCDRMFSKRWRYILHFVWLGPITAPPV
jgi:hypothetical protein